MPDSSSTFDLEDLITFSPIKGSITSRTSSIKQDIEGPSFVGSLVDHIQKEHTQAFAQASSKSDPFLDDSDDDQDPDEHQRLLNTCIGQNQSDSTAPLALALHLCEQYDGYSSNSDKLLTTYSPDLPMANPTPVREALFPPIASPGCVVTIHNLPYDICMRDILARISGGEIRSASLIKLSNAMCAVITFKASRSAQQFVHASKSFDDEIWTFKGTGTDADSRRAQVAYVPTLDTSKVFNDPVDIPIEPRYSMEIDLATRCLVIMNCSFKLIEEIWDTLCLPRHLRSPHYIHQFEDIWLDGFQRRSDGRIDSATLHVWYTSTNLAIGAKQAVAHRWWSNKMRFEPDPCDDTPAVLFFRPSDDAGFAWHSNPNYSLLNVYNAGCISELFRTWRNIAEAVNEARTESPEPDGRPRLLPSEDMAARCKNALTNGGFDPVTLISMSTQDYDSDDEGGRGPPRLDTRRIEAQRAALRKERFLSRNACLTVLINLAAKAPSAYTYCPGTCTARSTGRYELDSEIEWPRADFRKQNEDPGDGDTHDEIAEDESLTVAELQSMQTGDSKTSEKSCPKTNPAFAEQNLASLKKAFSEPTILYAVSLAEFLACNQQQHNAMGIVFYIPPKGHNSLNRLF